MILNNKVVVVTGGAGLLGKVFIKEILTSGGTAILTDIKISLAKDFIEEMKDKYPDSFYAANMDITSMNSINSLIKIVSKKYGHIDCLVNNAYPKNKNYGKRIEDVTYKDFSNNLSTHVGGYFLTSQQFGIFFKNNKGGNIINMGSIYGTLAPRFQLYKGTAMTTPVEYSAIKASIIQLTKYFAQYFKKDDIRVNCLSPGGILDNQPKSFITAYNSYCSKKGMLNPNDIANTLIFLISDSSEFITGQNLIVDDGFSL
ncbi:oxidoreductase [Methylophilaceae bacterium]|nr:oxidoreductase [Methylophilaceae bacterium]